MRLKSIAGRENERQQNQVEQLIKQEAHSVKPINISNEVNTWRRPGKELDICRGAAARGGGAYRRTSLQYEQQVSVRGAAPHVGAKAGTSLSWHLINETVSGCHRFSPSSLPPGWPFNIRPKRRPSCYRHVSTRWGHYGVQSRKVSVMGMNDTAVKIWFILD